MTILYNRFAGAESQDVRVDGTIFGGPNTAVAPAGWSIDTSIKKTGSASWKCVADGTHVKVDSLYFNPAAGQIGCVEFWIYLPGSPSAAGYIVRPNPDSANRLALEIGTDRKLRAANATTGAGLSGWSAALPVDTWCHVAWFIDGATFASESALWTVLLLDTGSGYNEEWAVKHTSGYQSHTFYFMDSGDIGITVYLDDMFGLFSTSATDRPHLTAWPLAFAVRQLPIDDVTTNWTKGSGGAGSYTEWDDPVGSDDVTTYNRTTGGTNKIQNGGGQTAATLGLAAGALIIESDATNHYGPMPQVVQYCNSVGGTKWNGQCANSLGGVASIQVTTDLAWLGNRPASGLPRTGGAWARADIDALDFGLRTGADGHQVTWDVSMMHLMWPIYESTLPLTSAPPAGVTETAVDRVGAATFMGLSVGVT